MVNDIDRDILERDEGAKATILVVEDEGIVAKELQGMLKQRGYTVPAIVDSGEKAIEEAAALHPDLVLMDIVLKGGVDGVEVAEQIRTRFNIPVVYLTAHAVERTLQRAKITEPYGYIVKPFDERELYIATEIALYKHKMDMKLHAIVEERTAELTKANEALKAEIAELKRAEEQIRASLDDRDMLLREVHHRVKNNLQIISSLLDMQSLRTYDVTTKDMLNEARAKIQAMSLIHSQLYQSDFLAQVDIGNYIRELVKYLSQVYRSGKKAITTELSCDDVYLTISQAIPCALALHELVSNAFKHAFTGRQKGTITVTLQKSDDNLVGISVEDDGISIPEEIDVYKTDTMGLKLVRNLVQEQLKGNLRVNQDNGTKVFIDFTIEGVEHA
jgi:two-component sensor histidine kinase